MLIATLISGLRRWLRHREAMRLLGGLDDRALHDLGISRSDIPTVIRYGR